MWKKSSYYVFKYADTTRDRKFFFQVMFSHPTISRTNISDVVMFSCRCYKTPP